MKYYAVTEDPNELMHFGIKGMKWGIIRTPEQLGHHKAPKKPRSPAYMKASATLSKAMRQGIAKAQANWDTYNSPENKQIRAEKRAINKEIHAYNRAEKKFQKHLQLARQGRLKYKGISDDEVSRITDRLALERNSRLLSGTEKASFGRRLKERVGEGIIEGVGRGTSGYISERMTGRGRTTAEIKGARRKIRSQFTPAGLVNRGLSGLSDRLDEAKQDRKAYRAEQRANQKADRDEQRQVKVEYRKLAAENGQKYMGALTMAEQRKLIADMKEQSDYDTKSKQLAFDAAKDTAAKARIREHTRLMADDKQDQEYRYEQLRQDRMKQGLLKPADDWDRGLKADYEHEKREREVQQQRERTNAEAARKIVEEQRRIAESERKERERLERMAVAKRDQRERDAALEAYAQRYQAKHAVNRVVDNRIGNGQPFSPSSSATYTSEQRRKIDYQSTSRKRKRGRGYL